MWKNVSILTWSSNILKFTVTYTAATGLKTRYGWTVAQPHASAFICFLRYACPHLAKGEKWDKLKFVNYKYILFLS